MSLDNFKDSIMCPLFLYHLCFQVLEDCCEPVLLDFLESMDERGNISRVLHPARLVEHKDRVVHCGLVADHLMPIDLCLRDRLEALLQGKVEHGHHLALFGYRVVRAALVEAGAGKDGFGEVYVDEFLKEKGSWL